MKIAMRRCVRALRARRERPRGRASEQRDELAASHHSITSSALASSVAGISRPSALAVLRLIVSSNAVLSVGVSNFSHLLTRPLYGDTEFNRPKMMHRDTWPVICPKNLPIEKQRYQYVSAILPSASCEILAAASPHILYPSSGEIDHGAK